MSGKTLKLRCVALIPALALLAVPAGALDAGRRAAIGGIGGAAAGALLGSIGIRPVGVGAAGGAVVGGGLGLGIGAASAKEGLQPTFQSFTQRQRPTNEVVATVEGIRRKRLGATDVVVSEVGLGTQRWGSTDFNGPDESLCHALLDRAVLEGGINLVDTAEQYPIPSDEKRPEGYTEEIIGRWLAKDKSRREKVCIATKITGGTNIRRQSLIEDLEGSLRRLQTSYADLYLLHWPARYTPQSNWGQSLAYDPNLENPFFASFEEIVGTMGALVQAGKIRGYGSCNDNAFGLTMMYETARRLNVPPPCTLQGDFSMLDRKIEENGVTEASSPLHLNCGFMAYNALAGGMLTGKYLDVPPGWDDPDEPRARASIAKPRGRMDIPGWGYTLYRYQSPAAKRAIQVYADLAKRNDMSLTELSLRWCRERPGITTTLLGVSSMEQLEQNLAIYSKSAGLPKKLVLEIDRQHMVNRSPIFSNDDLGPNFDQRGLIGERVP